MFILRLLPFLLLFPTLVNIEVVFWPALFRTIVVQYNRDYRDGFNEMQLKGWSMLMSNLMRERECMRVRKRDREREMYIYRERERMKNFS